MPIDQITVGGVTYTRRVRGVSKGGVVLPPGGVLGGYVSGALRGKVTPEEEEEEEDHGVPVFVPEIKAPGHDVAERKDEFGTQTPARRLGEESRALISKPASDQIWFIRCPIDAEHAAISLVAQMLNVIDHTRVIPGPGVSEEGTLEAHRHTQRAVDVGALPVLDIGWSPVLRLGGPRTLAWWNEEEDKWKVNDVSGPSWPPLRETPAPPTPPSPLFDVRYTVRLGWRGAKRPRDLLMVGLGNYAPRPGDYLYDVFESTLEQIREYEASVTPAELAALRASEAAGDPRLAGLQLTMLALFSQLQGLYERWEEAWEELIRIPHFHTGGGSIEEGIAIRETEETIARLKREAQALPGYEDQINNESELRNEKGPFLNDVSKWAYRFSLKKPPGGLPDFTKVSGYLVVRFSAPPGTRWLSRNGALGQFDTGQGLVAAMEMSKGSSSSGVTDVGTVLSGAVAR